jgi:hypothetical protein
VEWESPSVYYKYKADPSLKSFLFTLKNPHNVPARKFALREKDKAIAITAPQTPPTVTLRTLAALTPTTPASTGELFSRVGGISL